jgi:hypothetical protein
MSLQPLSAIPLHRHAKVLASSRAPRQARLTKDFLSDKEIADGDHHHGNGDIRYNDAHSGKIVTHLTETAESTIFQIRTSYTSRGWPLFRAAQQMNEWLWPARIVAQPDKQEKSRGRAPPPADSPMQRTITQFEPLFSKGFSVLPYYAFTLTTPSNRPYGI